MTDPVAQSLPSGKGGDAGPERTVLVVDDDPKIVALLRAYLEREGFRVVPALDGARALEAFSRHRPELVVLDLMLPEVDGMTVCRQIRQISSVPILMLTARVDEGDKVAGLHLGADDYVTKPFSPRELLARIRAILRRTAHSGAGSRLVRGSLVMDLDRHEVTVEGREVRLTPIEYKLLQALLESPGRVFTRDQLLARIYAFDETVVVDRTVDVHIARLREKLGDDPARPRFIQTVRGVGYKLLEPPRGQ